ncbi:uncharacterized protein LOC133716074 isoform X2 [Rosa rugosa]|uniref:uncharacterized protein LOC133716074 isoform X2 n=1 Tax=Rosa rugosa TaxID=74645 RepID=UPI002B4117EF|nr:uncharacterized protein LOC133716074 isoform X2 [Rosa rugosa]
MASAYNSGLSLATIEPLNGTNYKKWRSDIEIYLGLTGIDFCLTDAAPVLTDVSSDLDRAKFNEWARANRMSLLIMKRLMTDIVKGSIADQPTAREFLDSIAEKFTQNAKAETAVLLDSLTTMKYNGTVGMREHIMKLIDTTSKLKDLDMPLDDQFIVHQALNSLPSQFNQLKTTYNAQKDKWNLNELIAVCVQEEDRMKRDKAVTVNLVNKPQWQKYKGKGKAVSVSDSSKPSTSGVKKPFVHPKTKRTSSTKCFFCKKEGHLKRECHSFKKWMAKKGFSKEENPKKE